MNDIASPSAAVTTRTLPQRGGEGLPRGDAFSLEAGLTAQAAGLPDAAALAEGPVFIGVPPVAREIRIVAGEATPDLSPGGPPAPPRAVAAESGAPEVTEEVPVPSAPLARPATATSDAAALPNPRALVAIADAAPRSRADGDADLRPPTDASEPVRLVRPDMARDPSPDDPPPGRTAPAVPPAQSDAPGQTVRQTVPPLTEGTPAAPPRGRPDAAPGPDVAIRAQAREPAKTGNPVAEQARPPLTTAPERGKPRPAMPPSDTGKPAARPVISPTGGSLSGPATSAVRADPIQVTPPVTGVQTTPTESSARQPLPEDAATTTQPSPRPTPQVPTPAPARPLAPDAGFGRLESSSPGNAPPPPDTDARAASGDRIAPPAVASPPPGATAAVPAKPTPLPSRASAMTDPAKSERNAGPVRIDGSSPQVAASVPTRPSAGTAPAIEAIRPISPSGGEQPSDLAAFSRLADDGSSLRPDQTRAGPDTGLRTADAARSVQAQLVDAARQAPDGAIEVKLAPEELGRVRMTITQVDAEVMISVLVERAETLDLMRRHADILSAELRQAGFDRLSFSFGQGGDPATSGDRSLTRQGANDMPEGDVPAPPAPRAAATPAPLSGNGARLDIRL